MCMSPKVKCNTGHSTIIKKFVFINITEYKDKLLDLNNAIM